MQAVWIHPPPLTYRDDLTELSGQSCSMTGSQGWCVEFLCFVEGLSRFKSKKCKIHASLCACIAHLPLANELETTLALPSADTLSMMP